MNFIYHKKSLFAGAVVLAVIGLYFVFWGSGAPTIPAYTVTKQEYIPSLLISGEVIPESKATLSTLTSGTLQEIFVEKGTSVNKGQVIAQIDDRLARSAMERAQGEVQLAHLSLSQSATINLASARQNSVQMNLALEQAQLQYNRTEALFQAGAVSKQEFEQTEQALTLAQERSHTAKVALAALEPNGVSVAILTQQLNQRQLDLSDKKIQFEQYQVVAPFDGVILDLFAHEGELVQAGSKFAVLSSSKRSRIRIHPDQRYVNLASLNQTAQVWLPSDTVTKWPAKIVYKEPSGNSNQGSLTVELSLEQNIPELYPGRLVSVQIYGPRESDVIILPNSYLTEQDEQQGVWIVVQGNAHFLPVQIGLQTPEGALIVSDLKEGDIVLTPGNIKEGQNVTPQVKG